MVKIGSPPKPEEKKAVIHTPKLQPITRKDPDRDLFLKCLLRIEDIMYYKCLNGRGRHVGEKLQALAAELHQRLDKGGI
jgi:hypothetical protein